MSAVDELRTAIMQLEVWGQAPRRKLLRLLSYVENENNDLREALKEAAKQSAQPDETYCTCKKYINKPMTTAIVCAFCGKPPRAMVK